MARIDSVYLLHAECGERKVCALEAGCGEETRQRGRVLSKTGPFGLNHETAVDV